MAARAGHGTEDGARRSPTVSPKTAARKVKTESRWNGGARIARPTSTYTHDTAADAVAAQRTRRRRPLSAGQKRKLYAAFLWHVQELRAWVARGRKGRVPEIPWKDIAWSARFGVFAEGGKSQIKPWWKKFGAWLAREAPELVHDPPHPHSAALALRNHLALFHTRTCLHEQAQWF